MTYEVQQTRWDRIIRRVSGSIGPGSRVSETLSELFPVLDVERVPGELLLLGGTGIAQGGGTLQAAAGERATAQLFNPLDSNVLITVTKVYVAFVLGGTLRWGTSLVNRGGVISTQVFRDTRRILPTTPVGVIGQTSAAASATGTNQSRVLPDVPFLLKDENGIAVLAPGSGFDIGTNTVVDSIFYSFYWRERPAEESELSL